MEIIEKNVIIGKEEDYCTSCESYVIAVLDPEYGDYVCLNCDSPDLIAQSDLWDYWADEAEREYDSMDEDW